jgi:hypothetical protein
VVRRVLSQASLLRVGNATARSSGAWMEARWTAGGPAPTQPHVDMIAGIGPLLRHGRLRVGAWRGSGQAGVTRFVTRNAVDGCGRSRCAKPSARLLLLVGAACCTSRLSYTLVLTSSNLPAGSPLAASRGAATRPAPTRWAAEGSRPRLTSWVASSTGVARDLPFSPVGVSGAAPVRPASTRQWRAASV